MHKQQRQKRMMKMQTSYSNDVEEKSKWSLQNKTTSPETGLPREMNRHASEVMTHLWVLQF
jgi:hypothetical protein